MKRSELNRRDFNKLAAAAFGGVVTGTAIGCGKSKTSDSSSSSSSSESSSGSGGGKKIENLADTPNDWMGQGDKKDKHICRGLNSCKDKGKGGSNMCAGQGACATVPDATCGENNECRYLGGCKETLGQNACKGKGGCEIPLGDKSWVKARASFKEAMEKANQKIGEAPKKKS